jgi:hypothetical protein
VDELPIDIVGFGGLLDEEFLASPLQIVLFDPGRLASVEER